MTLTCLCCGFTQEFADDDAAYWAGWDTPARFLLGPFCTLCPSAPVALTGLTDARRRHTPLHEKWVRDGRPTAFQVVDEYALDELTPDEIADVERGIARLKQLVEDYRRKVH